MGNYQLIEIIFWISILAVSHTYLGYPLILLIISRFSKRNEKPCELEQLPSLAIFLSVFNEESIIKKKIENCFSLDFPQHLLEVAIASDGSSDSTNEILKFYKKKGVKTFINDLNLGKNATINKFFPKTKGDIIVFTDANSMLAPDALLNLARRFSNPRVGCVGGNLKYLHDNSPISKGEGLYFRYENIIRKFEGKMGRMVGANGAIYAIRRNLFVPVPSHVPNDFFQPLVVLKKGFDSVYEESAVAYEKPTQDKKEEFQRRTRIVTRSLGAIIEINKKYGVLSGKGWFNILSHKILRWFAFPIMLIGFFMNFFLLNERIYLYTLGIQISFLGLGLIGYLFDLFGKRAKIVYIPYYFLLINIAAMVGLYKYFAGKRISTWRIASTTR